MSDGFLVIALCLLWTFGGVIVALMLLEARHRRKDRKAAGIGSGDADQYGTFSSDGASGDAGGGDGGGDGGGGGD